MDWHIVSEPGWFLEHGWALTPETAGIAERDGWGPHRRPSIGWVRRRATRRGHDDWRPPSRRRSAGQPRRESRRASGRDDEWCARGSFLISSTFPAAALAGAGRYAKLTVSGTGFAVRTPPVAIEQFNLQSPDAVQFGFDEGWYEPEYNPRTAQSWRWMSERAVVRVHPAGRDVVMRMSGESPLRYFDQAPRIRVSVGDRVLLGDRAHSRLHRRGGDSCRRPRRRQRSHRPDARIAASLPARRKARPTGASWRYASMGLRWRGNSDSRQSSVVGQSSSESQSSPVSSRQSPVGQSH